MGTLITPLTKSVPRAVFPLSTILLSRWRVLSPHITMPGCDLLDPTIEKLCHGHSGDAMGAKDSVVLTVLHRKSNGIGSWRTVQIVYHLFNLRAIACASLHPMVSHPSIFGQLSDAKITAHFARLHQGVGRTLRAKDRQRPVGGDAENRRCRVKDARRCIRPLTKDCTARGTKPR